MIHYGDITKIKGADVPLVDIVCGGSPCQDLSVAGARRGLEGKRSGLFMDQIRVIREMRNVANKLSMRGADEHIRPRNVRYMVWENVQGTLTSGDPRGEDFRIVLEETARVADQNARIPKPPNGRWPQAGLIVGDGYSIAYRLHDSQWWGVPQRRKRLCMVADFEGHSAAEILFEYERETSDTETEQTVGSIRRKSQSEVRTVSESVSGNFEQIGEEGERITSDPQRGVDQADSKIVCIEGNGSRESHKGDGYIESDVMYTINTVERHGVAYRKGTHPHNPEESQTWEQTEINDTLNPFDSGENRTPTLIVDQKTFDARGNGDGKVTCTITGGHQSTISDYTAIVCESCNWDGSQTAPTLTARNAGGNQRMPDKENFQAVVSYGLDRAAFNQGKNAKFNFSAEEEKIGSCLSRGPGAVCAYSVVRRLTPVEVERLQGFPDHWTDIGEWTDTKGKVHKESSDASRYTALGNSIALPFWEWMAERMINVLKRDGIENPTMASLFDGIGGFPLVYSRHGCEPIWASEIEEFPIAVTKRRFPDGNKDTERQGEHHSTEKAE